MSTLFDGVSVNFFTYTNDYNTIRSLVDTAAVLVPLSLSLTFT
jgi:hypothetical protein